MLKEELIIDFNELCLDKIDKEAGFVSVIKKGHSRKYKIINTRKELMEHSSNSTNYSENRIGIIVTFECINIEGNFHNAIFLEKFKIDSYLDYDLKESLYLNFNNCDFFQDIELLGTNYQRIKINDSNIMKNLFIRFVTCEKMRVNNMIMHGDLAIENSDFIKFIANTSRFEENLLFQEVNVLNDFILDKVKGNKEMCFVDCRFEGLSKLELDVNEELNFSQCSFYKKSEINFDELNGKFSLYKTNFSDRCYLEYELLENKKYKPLIFENNFKKTKWNFLIVSDIYKSSGRTEQYLETLYYFKKYERLERITQKGYKFSLLDYLVEISTKYYTSWKRTLFSMVFIIMAFFVLYCLFPNLLICKDNVISSQDLFLSVFDMCKTSKYDMQFLISKFGNVIYFTIITFTTVGYGDITPLHWMKLVVGLESFLGVFFTSSFVVSLSRRFM